LVWGDAYRAHRLGVHIHQQTELTGINLERGQIRGVETTQRPIQTATVLNAAAVDPFASYSNRGSLGSSEGIAGRKLELFPPLGPARLMRRWAGICDRTADYILSRE
jgi:glycine/D-amino acid oxidase-like deaminating enzyme